MPEHSGPIYEVRLFVDRDVANDCDQWLEEHVRDSLRVANVADCNVFSVSTDDPDRVGRAVQHLLTVDGEADEFLDSFAAQIETKIASQFGDKVDFQSRVLRQDIAYDVPSGESPDCLNCGTHLRGQYCGNCGQRSRSRLIKLRELISEAFGDLFEIDSRLWQTIVPLVIRPGRLTYDYLQGRRARFMPPFRMYLVLSLIFFVVVFFNPREELGFFYKIPSQQETAAAIADEDEDGLTITFDDGEGEDPDDACDIEADGIEDLHPFITQRLTVERLEQVCEQIRADEGKSLAEKVTNNVPTALIVLLPLMALVLKALYPLSRRYYVEHLLFFVHLHAFLFLLFTLQVLFTRFVAAIAAPEAASTPVEVASMLVIVASSVYVPIYLFVAMRRVYAQSRFVTFLKFIALFVAYVIGFSTIMALTFAMAAFSI
jgi:hypothetical protein